MGDRGVERNDRMFTVSVFIGLFKGLENWGCRICCYFGVMLTKFNSLGVEIVGF